MTAGRDVALEWWPFVVTEKVDESAECGGRMKTTLLVAETGGLS